MSTLFLTKTFAHSLKLSAPYTNSSLVPDDEPKENTPDAFVLSKGTAVDLEPEFTTVTITSCSNHMCKIATSKAIVSLSRATSAGVVYTTTTYCPLPTGEKVSHKRSSEEVEIEHTIMGPSPATSVTLPSSTTKSVESSTGTTITPKLPTSVTLKPQTKVITITSCSNDLCHTSTTPVLISEVSTTTNGKVIVYTTYCPISETSKSRKSKTGESTKDITKTLKATTLSTSYITKTSCSDDLCHVTTSPVVLTELTSTSNGVEIIYTTYCPLISSKGFESMATSKVTDLKSTIVAPTPPGITTLAFSSCAGDKCSTTTVSASLSKVVTTSNGVITTLTTYCPITETISEKTSTNSNVIPTTVMTEALKTGSIVEITETFCNGDDCSEFTTPMSVSTVTTTINGVETKYTTYCPLTGTKVTQLVETIAVTEAISKAIPTMETTTATPLKGTTVETTLVEESPTDVLETIATTAITTTMSANQKSLTESTSTRYLTQTKSTTMVEVTSCSDSMCTKVSSVAFIDFSTTVIKGVTSIITTVSPLGANAGNEVIQTDEVKSETHTDVMSTETSLSLTPYSFPTSTSVQTSLVVSEYKGNGNRLPRIRTLTGMLIFLVSLIW